MSFIRRALCGGGTVVPRRRPSFLVLSVTPPAERSCPGPPFTLCLIRRGPQAARAWLTGTSDEGLLISVEALLVYGKTSRKLWLSEYTNHVCIASWGKSFLNNFFSLYFIFFSLKKGENQPPHHTTVNSDSNRCRLVSRVFLECSACALRKIR